MTDFTSTLSPKQDTAPAWRDWHTARLSLWLRICEGDEARATKLAYMEALQAVCRRRRVHEVEARAALRDIGIKLRGA
jgi:hypothetical protein